MKTRSTFLLLFTLVVGVIVWRSYRAPTAPAPPRPEERVDVVHSPLPEAAPANTDDGPNAESPEERQRRLLPGVWQDEYQGKRTMTLNDDGTGTMIVELTGVQASLFASRLQFDMQWSLAGDKLIKTTVGGEPAKKVTLILKMMGDTAEDTILEIGDDRLLLLDKNGKTEYDWKRVQPDDSIREAESESAPE